MKSNDQKEFSRVLVPYWSKAFPIVGTLLVEGISYLEKEDGVLVSFLGEDSVQNFGGFGSVVIDPRLSNQ